MSEIIVKDNGDMVLSGEITIKANFPHVSLDPKEVKEKINKMILELSSTPDKTEVEQKIHASLKGLTRRDAVDLLSKIRGDVIGNTPHDSGLEETL